jgi:hypothetical protein
MKQSVLLLISMLFIVTGYSQKREIDSLLLSDDETNQIFTEKFKKSKGILYPIRKVYNYKDKSGEYYLVLTERSYKEEKDNNFIDTIVAVNYKKHGTEFKQVWYMRDFIIDRNDSNTPEYSVWFWTKYLELKDFNSDGLIDPVIVYGTSGNDGLGDGRVKILTYYKGKKYAIRHQNGPYDMQRYTTVDAAFYNLPKQIQNNVIDIMDKIEINGHAIFAHSYREKMGEKITRFDDMDGYKF